MPKRKYPSRARASNSSVSSRRYKRRRQAVRVPRPLVRTSALGLRRANGPMPAELQTSFKFTYSVQLDSNGGNISSQIVSLNGLYQPIPSNSRQPVGWDQMMAFYDAYVVTGVKYKVRFVPTSAAVDDSPISTFSSICFAIPVDETAELGASNAVDLIQQAGCQYDIGGVLNSGPNQVVLSGALSPPTWLGRRLSNATSESLLRGTETSNPAEGCFLRFGVGPLIQAVSDMTPFNVLVDMEYMVTLFEPRSLAYSAS